MLNNDFFLNQSPFIIYQLHFTAIVRKKKHKKLNINLEGYSSQKMIINIAKLKKIAQNTT